MKQKSLYHYIHPGQKGSLSGSVVRPRGFLDCMDAISVVLLKCMYNRKIGDVNRSTKFQDWLQFQEGVDCFDRQLNSNLPQDPHANPKMIPNAYYDG